MAANTNNQQSRNQTKKNQEPVRYGSAKNQKEDDDIGNKDVSEKRSTDTMDDDDDDIQDDEGDRS